MELLIPIIAGAGLINMHSQEKKKEGYANTGSKNNKKLINNTTRAKNYPVISNDELRDSTVQGYQSQQPRDRYYSKDISYDNKVNN